MQENVLSRLFQLSQAPFGAKAKLAADCLRKLCSDETAVAKASYCVHKVSELESETDQESLIVLLESLR